MKTAFITGVSGQDGSYLAEFLLAKGYKVVGLLRRKAVECSSNLTVAMRHPMFVLEQGNMMDSASLWNILYKHKPDEIYNLAAQSHVHTSFEVPEETMNVNALGTLRLLDAMRKVVPNCRFYQASTSEMFGRNAQIPQDENSLMLPVSPYANAKLCAHQMCETYREAYSLFVCCGILFNHESERRGEKFVTRKITQSVARIKHGLDGNLTLGNVYAKRDWGHAEDYIKAMWMMLQHDKPDTYVVATGETHTVFDFVRRTFALAEIEDVSSYLKFDSALQRPNEVPALLGNPQKIRNVLGWKPEVTFEQLVERMYKHDEALVLKSIQQ